MDEIRDFLRSRSVANLTIVIINVAVFLILSCFGDTENADFMAAHGASYTPYIVQDGKYYLLITSMFLHFGLSHLFNNMVVLIFMGDILEKKLGKIRYLLIYFGGGIALPVRLYGHKKSGISGFSGCIRCNFCCDGCNPVAGNKKQRKAG